MLDWIGKKIHGVLKRIDEFLLKDIAEEYKRAESKDRNEADIRDAGYKAGMTVLVEAIKRKLNESEFDGCEFNELKNGQVLIDVGEIAKNVPDCRIKRDVRITLSPVDLYDYENRGRDVAVPMIFNAHAQDIGDNMGKVVKFFQQLGFKTIPSQHFISTGGGINDETLRQLQSGNFMTFDGHGHDDCKIVVDRNFLLDELEIRHQHDEAVRTAKAAKAKQLGLE